jgi:hypothetical protein
MISARLRLAARALGALAVMISARLRLAARALGALASRLRPLG